MQKSTPEPGVLQVFRSYGWLQLVPLIFLPVLLFLPVSEDVPLIRFLRPSLEVLARFINRNDLILSLIISGAQSFILLGYLYWSWPRKKLGEWYIPIALIFASVVVIIEQRLFFMRLAVLEILPLLYLLLILVAWQYGFRAVIVFTLGTAALDGMLNQAYPALNIIFITHSTSPTTEILLARGVLMGQVISRSLTFLVLGYVTSRLAATQRRQSQSLAEANQKLVQHASTLEQLATSRERVRLSRELHDTVAHTLSALAVEIEALLTISADMPEKAQEMLTQMQGTTQAGLNETRRSMQALRASPLEELGLAGAVRVFVEDFAARHRLALDMEVPDEAENISPEVEQAYYRVTQEALENVARHAHATRLAVRLLQQNGTLELSISDDGSGFQTDQESGELSMGLKGMQERAELIGAQLKIVSQPGEGTTVDMKMERSA